MAIPTFVAAGAKAAGTGAVTPDLPAGLQAGDICILVATTVTGGGLTLSAQGSVSWTEIYTGRDFGGAEMFSAWWGRYSSGSTGPTITPTSDHCCAGIAAYHGCASSGTPIHVGGAAAESGSDTTFSWATGLSTTVDDCIVLCCCTSGQDSNTGQFSAWANANLSSVTSRMNYETNAGGGGGFGFAEGGLATAGAIGTWSATLANASGKDYFCVALKPPINATVNVGLLSRTAAILSSSLNLGWTQAVGLLSQAAALFGPSVSLGTTVTVNLLTSTVTLYSVTVTTGGVDITVDVGLLQAVAALFGPSVQLGQTLTAGMLSGTATILPPSLRLDWTQTVGLIAVLANILAPSLNLSWTQAVNLVSVISALYPVTVVLPGVAATHAISLSELVSQAAEIKNPEAKALYSQIVGRKGKTIYA